MKFKIDSTIKRIYDIEYVRFDCASQFGAVFTVKCNDRQVYFEIEYVRLFNEFNDNTYQGMKEFSDFNLLNVVEYLIERKNKYILDKIVLALNDNECEVLKLEAYAD
jgi:hypothetical protein